MLSVVCEHGSASVSPGRTPPFHSDQVTSPLAYWDRQRCGGSLTHAWGLGVKLVLGTLLTPLGLQLNAGPESPHVMVPGLDHESCLGFRKDIPNSRNLGVWRCHLARVETIVI